MTLKHILKSPRWANDVIVSIHLFFLLQYRWYICFFTAVQNYRCCSTFLVNLDLVFVVVYHTAGFFHYLTYWILLCNLQRLLFLQTPTPSLHCLVQYLHDLVNIIDSTVSLFIKRSYTLNCLLLVITLPESGSNLLLHTCHCCSRKCNQRKGQN